MKLVNKELGTLPRDMIDKIKAAIGLFGQKGSLRLDAENAKVNIPINDDLSIDVFAPNTIHYQFVDQRLIVTFDQQPLVCYRGSGLLSKYLKSVTAGPEKITLDLGWVTASFDLE